MRLHRDIRGLTLTCLLVAACGPAPDEEELTTIEQPLVGQKTRVTGGLSRPTAMAVAPDGRIFVCERGTNNGGGTTTARVRVIKNGVLLGTPFTSITVDNKAVSANERGLLGIAVDPNFASNRFVYTYYTAPTTPARNQVVRFTASGDVGGSPVTILQLDALSSTAGNHNGGALSFGLDGKLYIAVGDNRTPANSTNLGNHLGKLLRINPVSGSNAPSDNPFYNAADGIGARDRIWAYGLRNPFTFAVQRVTGRIFVNDVGENSREEIDDIRKGRDYGWRGGATDGDATAFFKYSHGSGTSAGNCITGGAFYNPSTVPATLASLQGKYLYADYCNGWIRTLDPATKASALFDSGLSSPLDIDVASDGTIYFLLSGSGEVWKVTGGSAVQEIVVSTSTVTLNEGGSGTFTVKLAKQPASNVVVNVARTAGTGGAVTPSPSSLTFTSTNWSTARTVTLSAAQDGDDSNEGAAITCSASGLASKRVAAIVRDDENQGPVTTITLPTAGQSVSGSGADFFGGSNLDGSTTRAEFFVDGVLKYTDNGSGHYHYGGGHGLWNTTGLSNGTHTLMLRIWNSAGKQGNHRIPVTVAN